MSHFYNARLGVSPFIIAPVGDRQQSFVLSRESFTRNTETFIESVHKYEQELQPSLPIICEIRRLGWYVVASTTLETDAIERATGRAGCSLTIGIVVSREAIATIPQLFTTAFGMFRDHFFWWFERELSPEGGKEILDAIQTDQKAPIATEKLRTIVRAFEQSFGLEAEPRLWSRIRSQLVYFIFVRRAPSLSTHLTYVGALEYWRAVDTIVFPERPIVHNAGEVKAEPITYWLLLFAPAFAVTTCFIADRFVSSRPHVRLDLLLLDIALTLAALIPLGYLDTLADHSGGSTLTHRRLTPRLERAAWWIVRVSAFGLWCFIAWTAIRFSS